MLTVTIRSGARKETMPDATRVIRVFKTTNYCFIRWSDPAGTPVHSTSRIYRSPWTGQSTEGSAR